MEKARAAHSSIERQNRRIPFALPFALPSAAHARTARRPPLLSAAYAQQPPQPSDPQSDRQLVQVPFEPSAPSQRENVRRQAERLSASNRHRTRRVGDGRCRATPRSPPESRVDATEEGNRPRQRPRFDGKESAPREPVWGGIDLPTRRRPSLVRGPGQPSFDRNRIVMPRCSSRTLQRRKRGFRL